MANPWKQQQAQTQERSQKQQIAPSQPQLKPAQKQIEAIGFARGRLGVSAVRVLCDESCVVEETPENLLQVAAGYGKRWFVELMRRL